jgi:hypothetical protein
MPRGDAAGGASVASGRSSDDQTPRRTNQARDLHCYNFGALDHWAHDCPELSSKQQAQLHMNVQGMDDTTEFEEGHQLLNVSLMQGGALPDKRAYLD